MILATSILYLSFPSLIGTGYRPSSIFSTQPSRSYIDDFYDIWNNACLYCCRHFKSRRWRRSVCRVRAPCYEVRLSLLLHPRWPSLTLLCRSGPTTREHLIAKAAVRRAQSEFTKTAAYEAMKGLSSAFFATDVVAAVDLLGGKPK